MQEIKAISFDCYGTLVDWESGIKLAFRNLFLDQKISEDEDKLLELFAKHESDLESRLPIIPYFDVLDQVAQGVAKEIGADVSASKCKDFAESIEDWPLYDDVMPMLKKLNKKYIFCILSNVDRRCFSVTENKFEGMINIVSIAEDNGFYKPSPEAFMALLSKLAEQEIKKDELLHVAQSLFHDHEPASKLGIKSCWVDRRLDKEGWGAVPPPENSVEPTFRIKTLAELPNLLAT
ncbi:MAG: HAD family hydrolase [Pseudomonadota bacterium]|nr:HAD family hydrolase [Pseudomonadota bacterium]